MLAGGAGLTVLIGVSLSNSGCNNNGDLSLVDDAGGRKPEDLPEIAEDVFKPMDGGVALSPDEIKGRNTWNLWCAGTEQFWERMSRESYGLIDLLKTIDSRGRSTHLIRRKTRRTLNGQTSHRPLVTNTYGKARFLPTTSKREVSSGRC